MSKGDVGHFQVKPVKIQHASPIPSYPFVFSQIIEHRGEGEPSDLHQTVMEVRNNPVALTHGDGGFVHYHRMR